MNLAAIPVDLFREMVDQAREAGDTALLAYYVEALEAHAAEWVPQDYQRVPEGNWSIWALFGGRGSGKSDSGAGWMNAHALGPPCDRRLPGGHRMRIIGPTFSDTIASCVTGPTGLKAHNPQIELVGTKEGTLVRWPNGAYARIHGAYTPEDPERLRAGGNSCADWMEELAAMRQLEATWDQANFGLRIGENPRTVITTTPKNRAKIRELSGDGKAYMQLSIVERASLPRDSRVHLVVATTEMNRYLPKEVRDALYKRYAGTRLGAQELEAQILDDLGTFFSRAWFGWLDAPTMLPRKVRSWDLAGTPPGPANEDPDWSVGALIAYDPQPQPWKLADGTVIQAGRFVIEDVIRLRDSPAQVEQAVVDAARRDGPTVKVVIEKEPGQSGKPIYTGEMILMRDGSRRALESVAAGDWVISHEGRPCVVTETFEQGLLPSVKITTHSGRTVTTALDHPFLTPSGWREARDLVEGAVLGLVAAPSVIPVTKRLPEEYRLTGYFLGDGSCGPSSSAANASICSTITVEDEEERADIEECVAALGFATHTHDARPLALHLKGGVKSWLREIGLAGKRSYDKRVPEWVFTSPDDLIAELLGAYFACDGHLDRTKGVAEFYSVSRCLLEDVQHLLLRLGIATKLAVKNGRYKHDRHESWRLILRGSEDGWARFVERVPVHHSSKASRLNDLSPERKRFDSPLLPDVVTTIEAVGDQPCRCLAVAGDNSFTVKDLAVHNSQIVHFQQALQGIALVEEHSPSGPKAVRAQLVSGAAQQGRVDIVRGPWNQALLDEMEEYTGDEKVDHHDDQIDALSQGFAALEGRGGLASAQAPTGHLPSRDAMLGRGSFADSMRQR